MKVLYSIVTVLALLAIWLALPTMAAPPGDSPILIITPAQVVPDGTPPEIIRPGTMIAEFNFDSTNKAPALEPPANFMRPGLTRDTQHQHTAPAGEIILARSLKGDSALRRSVKPRRPTG